MSDIQHTYSYTAVFEDGKVIFHDHTDENSEVSEVNPQKTKFFDVLEHDKVSKLVSFVIHNDTQSLGVDLRDGHFELNTIPFWQHRPEIDGYKNFRIIYYRTVERTLNQVDGQQVNAGIKGYTVGWQTNDSKGNNVQRTVTI